MAMTGLLILATSPRMLMLPPVAGVTQNSVAATFERPEATRPGWYTSPVLPMLTCR